MRPILALLEVTHNSKHFLYVYLYLQRGALCYHNSKAQLRVKYALHSQANDILS